jgi:hypothetical protein
VRRLDGEDGAGLFSRREHVRLVVEVARHRAVGERRERFPCAPGGIVALGSAQPPWGSRGPLIHPRLGCAADFTLGLSWATR